jgi:hypothetical protein
MGLKGGLRHMKVVQVQKRIERNPQLITQVVVRKSIAVGLIYQWCCAFNK